MGLAADDRSTFDGLVYGRIAEPGQNTGFQQISHQRQAAARS